MRIAIPVFASLVVACQPAAPGCFEVPGVATAELRGGGWDLNGTSMRGGWDGNARSLGGWDANGALPGAELEGVSLTNAVTGAEVTLDHGRLEGAELALVATTSSGAAIPLTARLVRVEGDVPLYEVTVEGTPVCDGLAMFAPGSWTATGEHVAADTVTLACERGVIAKCALWGYAPWTVGSELHTACTRMARADYCGDGHAWTRDGTLIDVTDAAGIQPLAGGEEMSFEAGWNEHGAVCVRASRYDVVGTDGETVLPPCWDALPRCEDLVSALEDGALVANYALHETIAACH